MSVKKSGQRCKRCQLQLMVCICEVVPTLDCRTNLTLLVHVVEARKPTNSGILASRCLSNSQVLVRGAPEPLDGSKILLPGYQPLILFPSERAVELSHEYLATFDKAIQLIVPDGNWKQAKRMPKREPALHGVPHVVLPSGPYSNYILRREPRQRPNGLATMEAIARAMDILEGAQVHDTLMTMFNTMVQRCLWQRGKIRDEFVFGDEGSEFNSERGKLWLKGTAPIYPQEHS